MLSSVASRNFVIMNMLLNKCSYPIRWPINSPMKINEIHQLHDNQPVHSSKAMVDKMRGSGGRHSVNVASQWLLITTPPHSSQYVFVPLLIYDLSLYDWALRAATKWQPVLKRHYTYLQKSHYYLPSSPRKIVYWMPLYVCFIYGFASIPLNLDFH